MLSFLVSLTAARQSRVKCPLQANLILVVGWIFRRLSKVIMLQITDRLAKGSQQPYLAVGRLLRFFVKKKSIKKRKTRSSISVWSMRLGDESPRRRAAASRTHVLAGVDQLSVF